MSILTVMIAEVKAQYSNDRTQKGPLKRHKYIKADYKRKPI